MKVKAAKLYINEIVYCKAFQDVNCFEILDNKLKYCSLFT